MENDTTKNTLFEDRTIHRVDLQCCNRIFSWFVSLRPNGELAGLGGPACPVCGLKPSSETVLAAFEDQPQRRAMRESA